MKKTLLIFASILLIFVSTLGVYGAPPQIPIEYDEELPLFSKVWTTCNVNFRELPSLNCEIYEVIPQGTEVTVLGYDPNSNWTQAHYNGHIGFLYTSLLSKEYISPYKYYYLNEWQQPELDHDLQRYAQDLLREWGMIDYFPIFLCQAFQESRYDMNCIGRAHGGYYDYGIMQIWQGHEFDSNSILYEVIKANPDYKTNPYQNIYCGLYIMKLNYERCGDYMTALGCYLTGNNIPSQQYISDVMSHYYFLVERS